MTLALPINESEHPMTIKASDYFDSVDDFEDYLESLTAVEKMNLRSIAKDAQMRNLLSHADPDNITDDQMKFLVAGILSAAQRQAVENILDAE